VLDGALIKSLVSCDITSARNLFAAERVNIENRGKLWISANKTLKLGYDDPALMDRLRILPYNARWVANPAEVKAGMTDLTTSGNTYFKNYPMSKYVPQLDLFSSFNTNGSEVNLQR